MSTPGDITADARDIQGAAQALRDQAEALEQFVHKVFDPSVITDAQSLHRMADHIQTRADTAHVEKERLQDVADRLRKRARAAAEEAGDTPARR